MHIPKVSPEKAKEFFEAKMAFTTGPVEASRMIKERDQVAIIDVRAKKDFDQGHVPGAINLPKDEWSNLQALSREKLNIVYCYSIVCHLAAEAAIKFAGNGFHVMEMDGGFRAWKDHNLEIETGAVQKAAS